MQTTIKQVLTIFGLHRQEQSLSYAYPPLLPRDYVAEDLSDEEYAVLLAEIDQFSAQFLAQQKQTGLEETSPV